MLDVVVRVILPVVVTAARLNVVATELLELVVEELDDVLVVVLNRGPNSVQDEELEEVVRNVLVVVKRTGL